MVAPNLELPSFLPAVIAADPALTPFLKWPGGKTQELPAIATVAPSLEGRFIDPFVGGGSVLLAVVDSVPAWANDACPELIGLFRASADNDQVVRGAIDGVARAWMGLEHLQSMYEGLAASFLSVDGFEVAHRVRDSQSTLASIVEQAGPAVKEPFLERVDKDLHIKMERMRTIQSRLKRQLSSQDLLANIEGSVRSSFYMTLRARYNRARLGGSVNEIRLADFYFLREFTYAAMFRFNARGEFNVPYGGVSYNRKSLSTKAEQLFSEAMRARLATTTFRTGDFEPFLAEAAPLADDFVFVDPPYDSDFSDYDNRSFAAKDQVRLRNMLVDLPAKVMVVIKDTPAIRALYSADRWHTLEAEKTYMWTIKSRNDRSALHLTLTNYVPEAWHRSHR